MMIEHSKSVRKGVKKSLLIVDMPFNTYKNKSQALKNCKKVMKETKCDGICLLYTSPSPRDEALSRMPSSA